jgi:uncharacterized membrane protein
MPHCTRCGTMVEASAAFCSNCGQPQGTAPSPAGAQSGLSENAAALFAYSLGWLTGLIFLLIDKRPYVRYHAAQSLVLFGALHVVRSMLGMMFGFGWLSGGWGFWPAMGIGAMFLSLLGLLTFALWIYCMIRAWQGERFRIPVAAEVAESLTR